jgi:hypothetical protein
LDTIRVNETNQQLGQTNQLPGQTEAEMAARMQKENERDRAAAAEAAAKANEPETRTEDVYNSKGQKIGEKTVVVKGGEGSGGGDAPEYNDIGDNSKGKKR